MKTSKKAYGNFAKYQEKVKQVFNMKTSNRQFHVDDLVLLWNKQCEKLGDHGKFDSLWLEPCQIHAMIDKNAFFLKNLAGEWLTLPISKRYLKYFFP
jgi:hypothetical protein